MKRVARYRINVSKEWGANNSKTYGYFLQSVV
jgi:hypothetical protein